MYHVCIGTWHVASIFNENNSATSRHAADAEVSFVTTSARDEKRISLVDFKPGVSWHPKIRRQNMLQMTRELAFWEPTRREEIGWFLMIFVGLSNNPLFSVIFLYIYSIYSISFSGWLEAEMPIFDQGSSLQCLADKAAHSQRHWSFH